MTTDSIVLEAQAKREQALAEVARWTTFIEMYRQLGGGAAQSPRPATASGRGSKLIETEEAAVVAIKAAGRPMKTDELIAAITAAGIEVGGQSPSATLSARLSRAPSLVNDRKRGWCLASDVEQEAAINELLGVPALVSASTVQAPPPAQAPWLTSPAAPAPKAPVPWGQS